MLRGRGRGCLVGVHETTEIWTQRSRIHHGCVRRLGVRRWVDSDSEKNAAPIRRTREETKKETEIRKLR